MSIVYYIEDLIEFNINEEFPIKENLILKSASFKSQSTIKAILDRFIKNPFGSVNHESNRLLKTDNHNLAESEKDRPKYFVLESKNTRHFNLFIPRALLLIEKEFFCPFIFSPGNKGGLFGVVVKYSFGELSAFTYYNDKDLLFTPRKWDVKSFTSQDYKELIETLNALEKFDNVKDEFPYISKALEDYFKISELSDNSVFKVVSYIACLELLLVDNSMDKLKSINLQIQTKLNLVNNRLMKPIVVSEYIKGPDTLNLGIVIGIIYNYRSSIAHGDFLDFNKKLKILEAVSMDDILKLLRLILRKTILFSLNEPELIRDLKKC